MDIGQNIKKLREAKNMLQEELADKLGVTTQMISHYENNVHTPRGEKMKKLAKILGVSVSEIYSNTISEPKPQELTKEDLAKELIIVNQKYQKLLELGNADKDKIIALQEKIDELKDKYERKQG